MKNEIQKKETGLQVQQVENNQLSSINLENMAIMPIDLISDYWTPENDGESRRVIFQRVEIITTISQGSGEVIDLPCAVFVTPIDGKLQSIRNGSKKLVGAVESLPANTPLLITYKGKMKNKTNGFKSDNWSVQPLIIAQ